MTIEEAKVIIRKEYLCVNRDCNIERSCGKCDLVMPSKEPILEAYKVATQALDKCDKIEKIINSDDNDFVANYVRGLFAE